MFSLSKNNRNNSIATFNPFRDIEEMEKEFWNEPFGTFFRNTDIAEFKTDIKDEGDHYLLEADLPGFRKEDISLDINGDTLVINAERKSEHSEEDKKNKYIRCERSYGKYSRQFDVSTVNADGIRAKYENGVLTLVLPKKNDALPEGKHLQIE